MKLLIAIFLLSFLATTAAAEKLPVETFSQLPDVANLSLSPDGNKIASMVRVDLAEKQGTAVQVVDPKTKTSKILLFSDNKDFVIYRVYWKDNKTLLVHGFAPLEQKTWGYGQKSAHKIRATRLLFVNAETGEVTKPFTKMFLSQYKFTPPGLDTVVDTLPNDPDFILMGLYGDVYKVNIHKGTTDIYGKLPKTFFPHITDTEHRLRAGYHYDQDGTFTIKYYDLESESWKDLTTFKGFFSKEDLNLLGFGENPNELFISSYHQDRLAIFKINLKDPEFKRELVLADEHYDINGSLVYSPDGKKVIGVTGKESGGTFFFDNELKNLQTKIDKALPTSRNYLYSFTHDLNKFIVFSTGPKESGTYYLGQRSPLKIEALAYSYKKLPPEILANVTRIEYKARDGLPIEAYLTLPNNKPAKNLPTLMFPHGGPIARDSHAFDYWAQFFANKGYAVLQMNFRGSAGQGLSHRNAGLGKWGKEMQDDIEDGAHHLINQGISDPKAIAIVGASYGGYAALMGVVKTPDFYRCSISVAGVSNVYELVLDNRAFWNTYNVIDEMIGTGAKNLKDISPVNHADKIKVPVLLIHGDDDRQVDIKHSEQMRDKLLQAGKSVEYLSLPEEDHYLSNEKNRINTFKAMDKFLNKCLPIK
jgi:dipeptidyl aminopeptidase/acylaminoacyl peptidase